MLQDTPVADAKPDDIKDLLGGALFKALFKWMQESGPIYLLPTGAMLCIAPAHMTAWLHITGLMASNLMCNMQ